MSDIKKINPFEISKEEEIDAAINIFSNEIANKTPSQKPIAIIVIGQPGAGKTGVMSFSEAQFPDAVALDIDKFREYHPRYKVLSRHDAKFFEQQTGQFASNIMMKYFTPVLINERYDLILHKTRGDEAIIFDTIKPLKEKGYDVIFRVLAVNDLESKTSAVYRSIYERMLHNYCKWINPVYHDTHYNNILNLIEILEKEKIVDCIEVYSRGDLMTLPNLEYSVILNNESKNNPKLQIEKLLLIDNYNPQNFKSAKDATEKIRLKGVEKTLESFDLRLSDIKKLAVFGDEQDYIDDLEKTANKYREKAKT